MFFYPSVIIYVANNYFFKIKEQMLAIALFKNKPEQILAK